MSSFVYVFVDRFDKLFLNIEKKKTISHILSNSTFSYYSKYVIKPHSVNKRLLNNSIKCFLFENYLINWIKQFLEYQNINNNSFKKTYFLQTNK